LVEAIITSLENNKHAVEVFIDLNEAFDIVDTMYKNPFLRCGCVWCRTEMDIELFRK